MKIIEFTPKNSPLIKARFAIPLRRNFSEARASARRGVRGIKNSINPPTPPLYKGGNTILALGAESAGGFAVFSNHFPALSFRPRIMRGRNPLKVDNFTYKRFLAAAARNDKNKKLCSEIYFSDDFGDLLNDNNFKKFQKAVLDFLKKNKIKPDVILTDLHPLYKTTIWGKELAKKFKGEHIQIQHHIAHIFSAVGENMLNSKFKILNPKQIQSRIVLRDKIQNSFFGIALDGTGYGLDGKIWGGEIFECRMSNVECRIKRIGHLENQTMIGADLTVKEPARMLISILAKIPPSTKGVRGIYGSGAKSSPKFQKNFIYNFVKKYYTRNQFELLYNQLQSNFNCQETSSAGRILDAVSLLLGFCENERNYKHEASDLLKKNSTKPYKLPPLIKGGRGIYTLQTTYLFEYLIKNLYRDKRRLAAAAQLYIAQGLYEIIKKQKSPSRSRRAEADKKAKRQKIFLAGGISNNKIILNYLKSKGAYVHPVKLSRSKPRTHELTLGAFGIFASRNIDLAVRAFWVRGKFNGVPRGDAGISFGQIIYFLANKKGL